MEREIIASDSVPALCGERESRKRNEGMETPARKMGNGKTEEGKNRIVRDLTSGNVARTMIWFAAPLFLSSLLQTTYNMADMIIIGHFVGKEGVAAASIGGDVLLFASFVAMGFANAGQVIISQLVGAGRHDKVNRLIGTMFTVLLCCAMLIGSLGLIFQETLLQWLNTPPEALEYTRAYTDVCLTGLVFIYGYNVVSAVLRGMGDSKHPFYFIALATGLNVVLDLVLVVGFRMAIFGVALATVISQAVSFCWAVTFLYRRKTAFGFDFKLRSFAVDREVLIPFLKLGIPMMIQGASIDFSKLFVNAWINSYGVLATAMTGIGNKVGSVVNVVNVALSTAGSSMIGQCIGAEKYERVPKVLKVSFSINIAISLAMGIVTVLFPSMVFGIFTGDAEVLKLSLRYIPVALLLFAGSALSPPMSSLINGSGNFKLNLAVALLDGVFMRIGLSALLGLGFAFGVYGFWYGSALASFTPFVIGGVYFLSGRWRTRKYLIRDEAPDKIPSWPPPPASLSFVYLPTDKKGIRIAALKNRIVEVSYPVGIFCRKLRSAASPATIKTTIRIPGP